MISENEMMDLLSYSVSVRRQLHEYPEVGFELERTTTLVEAELDKMGIPCTTKYGKGSLVAEIGQGDNILAFRADMDALPVEEKNDLPYRSKIPGQMHACGHDSHTGVLLAVAKYLKEHESELGCKVRFIFQPSEEGAVSGAKMMVEHGVMDGVSQIICTHCENALEAGVIGLHAGEYMAACIPATIRFLGRTSHATLPEYGIDANAMAVEAYYALKDMVKEEAKDMPFIWSVGRLSGGHVHNVISDKCEMDISFRFYDMEFAKRVEKRMYDICEKIAETYGGKVEYVWNVSTGAVYNDEEIVRNFEAIVKKSGLMVQEVPRRLSSEDFGWYLGDTPGMLFRFGTRNEKLGCIMPAHRNDFMIDEEGMKSPIKAFIAYALHENK